MNPFKQTELGTGRGLIAKELTRARGEAGLGLEQAAKATGINRRYLAALEEGRFQDLPEGIYGRNYLKEYARFLRADAAGLAALYDEEAAGGPRRGENRIFSRQAPLARHFLALPRTIRALAVALAVLLCLSYLGYKAANIAAPPDLELLFPAEDAIVGQSPVLVRGRTEAEAEIAINGEAVLPDADGYFAKEVNLGNGVNEIAVSARRKYSRTSTVVRKIIFETDSKQ